MYSKRRLFGKHCNSPSIPFPILILPCFYGKVSPFLKIAAIAKYP